MSKMDGFFSLVFDVRATASSGFNNDSITSSGIETLFALAALKISSRAFSGCPFDKSHLVDSGMSLKYNFTHLVLLIILNLNIWLLSMKGYVNYSYVYKIKQLILESEIGRKYLPPVS